MIYARFGHSNAAIIMKINTFMMSYEFNMFVQLVINGVIEPTNMPNSLASESSPSGRDRMASI